MDLPRKQASHRQCSPSLQIKVSRIRKLAMPVRMGINCERCHKVHFIGTSSGIKTMPMHGMYALFCHFCSETREFRKEMMRPYRVSDEVFKTGFAKERECELIQPPRQPSKST